MPARNGAWKSRGFVAVTHAGANRLGQAPARRSFLAQLFERHAEHGGADLFLGESGASGALLDLEPFILEIEHDQQLADLWDW